MRKQLLQARTLARRHVAQQVEVEARTASARRSRRAAAFASGRYQSVCHGAHVSARSYSAIAARWASTVEIAARLSPRPRWIQASTGGSSPRTPCAARRGGACG